MIIAGGILHLLVVALPLFCLGLVGTSIADPAVLIFLAGASSLYAGDAVTMQWWSSESRSPLNARAKRWATVMGGLLLLLFWACLVGVPGGRAWWNARSQRLPVRGFKPSEVPCFFQESRFVLQRSAR